ncbi:MAG TPA: hypothetical protein VGV37_25755 [Aliidongia sp.]|uniref:hypothetical protein n=1 Tax=Aliidongia sp. TaxID=1914230 RepID=UPI002DDD50D7|nr:hypothetical protein [Aliidongia sp.]HEV2677963.1 hypothetical protein [Aliidongia sp.]
MDTLTFIASLAKSFAWPIVVIVFLILTRASLGTLIERLSELALPGGAKFKFNNILRDATKEAAKLEAPGTLITSIGKAAGKSTARGTPKSLLLVPDEPDVFAIPPAAAPAAPTAPMPPPWDASLVQPASTKSPEAIIASAYAKLLNVVAEVANKLGDHHADGGLPLRVIGTLTERGLVTLPALSLFEKISALQPLAAGPASDKITLAEAFQFAGLCQKLSFALHEAADRL